MVDEKQIKKLLFKYFVEQYDERAFAEDEYHIMPDGTVDVDVPVGNREIKFPSGELPIRFGRIDGDFDIHNLLLTTLEGSAHTVIGNFDCSHNRISSLDGAPSYISESFSCNNNRLTSLANCPLVKEDINVEFNQLTTLDGLAATGCRRLDVTHNPLIHLRGLPPTVNTISVTVTPTLPILGVLMAKHVELYQLGEIVRFKEMEKVIQPFMGQNSSTFKRAMFACGAALVKAGFASNAKY
jgi:hypothetical protein